MNTVVPHKQQKRSLPYILLLPALAVCVCLQLGIAALVPQGFLAALISLFKAPGYASYPYNTSMQVTLFSSPTMLYAGMVPDSFALRTGDGTAVQKVPERLFAVYKDILYTSTFTADLQGGATLLRALSESDGKLLWSYSFENLNNVQLVDGILYLNKAETWQQQGLLQALDPESGRLLWQYQCSSQDCYVGSPQALNGTAYVEVQESAASALLALRISDGSPLWRVASYADSIQPLLTTDRLLMQTSSDTYTAYSAIDGRLLWQKRLSPANTGRLRTISNGSVCIIQTSTALYALRLDSGSLLWQWQGSPTGIKLSDTEVYLAEPAGLLALNASSGQKMWQQAYPSWAASSAKTTSADQGNTILGESNGMIYTLVKGDQNGFAAYALFAFRAVDGQMTWQHRFTLATGPGISMPPGEQSIVAGSDMEALLVGNSVYVISYLAVTTILPVHFTISLTSALSSFFNTTTFTLTAQSIDAQTGNVRWHTQQVEQFHVA